MAFINKNNLLPPHCRDQYITAAEEIASIYNSLLKDVPFHRIHGDCHMGNLLHGRDGWFFLDFDDFVNGPAVQDIWMLAPAIDSEGVRQRDVLLEGYREFRDFENLWLRLVEVLRAVRYIRYAAWIAKRWADPAFPAIFPHFGTGRYWEDETSDLVKQLNLIKKSLEGPSVPAEPEKELTNKDFFWDME
jgi:Ser/Thr protein kinase RdoA (MazF antagonist)